MYLEKINYFTAVLLCALLTKYGPTPHHNQMNNCVVRSWKAEQRKHQKNSQSESFTFFLLYMGCLVQSLLFYISVPRIMLKKLIHKYYNSFIYFVRGIRMV